MLTIDESCENDVINLNNIVGPAFECIRVTCMIIVDEGYEEEQVSSFFIPFYL